jgi:glycosyltransferase involved in cell wall biosynthesis
MTSITVVIPAYNEGATFPSTLVKIAEYYSIYRASGYDFQYLIVDDGSTDETADGARSFARFRDNVRILTHDSNRGLGAALRTAFAAATTEIVLVLDADLSYSPLVGMELVEALEREDADMATASPFMRGGAAKNVPWPRLLLSREANRLLSFATSGRYGTLTCMVRAYRRSVFGNISFESNGMDANAELMLAALRRRMNVVEVPATLQWSNERRAAVGRFRLARVFNQIWHTIRLAFSYRPALWLAVPGLFPGLLPLVVAVLFILHASPSTMVVGTAVAVVVQYTSFAIFAGQLGSFFAGRFRKSNRQTQGVQSNGYHVPKRTA